MSRQHPEIVDLSRAHITAKEGVAHAIHQLQVQLSKPRFNVKAGGAAYNAMRRDCPYVIHETNIKGTQILVNRHYKPIGSNAPTGGPFLRYEEYKNSHVQLSPKQIAALVSPPHDRGLFGDGNPPWRKKAYAQEYLVRLKKLYSMLP